MEGGLASFGVWRTDKMFLAIMYVVEQEDVTAVPFTWEYQNPFN